MLNDIKTRKSITDSEKNEFRKPNSATLEAYFDSPIKRQIFNGIVILKNKSHVKKWCNFYDRCRSIILFSHKQ
ncbi:hypothetical protein [Mycoplasma sp. 327]